MGGERRAVLRETPAVPRAPQCCRGTHVLLQPETSSGPGWEGEPVEGGGSEGKPGCLFPLEAEREGGVAAPPLRQRVTGALRQQAMS